MRDQGLKDLEEFNLGLSGVPTGSVHNQDGLSSRYRPSDYPSTTRKKANTPKNSKPNAATVTEDDKIAPWIALIAFIFTSAYIYNPNDENIAPAIAAGIFVAFLAGKLYKVILFVAFVLIGAFVFGQINP